jgi:peptidoglycan hydrolase-like protein with peptidoglycan-binding domain
MALQQQLNARGANLDVDGKFGPLTEAALKQFQHQSGCASSGRVDAGTVAALSTTPAPASTTTPTATPTATTPKASAEAQGGARAKSAAGEAAVAAQLAAALPQKPATPAAPTPAATTSPTEPSVALAPEQVQTALGNIELGKKQAAQEKEILGQVRGALEREVTELKTKKPDGTTPTIADQAVLTGRESQLDAVKKAEGIVDMKLEGYDAAGRAVSDGVLTETEAKALTTVDEAVRTSETAVTTQMSAANALVDRGLRAGGRGSPALGLRKPETPTTPSPTTPTPAGTAIPASDVAIGQANIKTAIAGAQAELTTLGAMRTDVETEVKALKGLSGRTVADDAMLQGRQAQLQVLDGAKQNIELRIAGLQAADRAISDGVLTDDEAKNLAQADAGIKGGEQALAAQAAMATELIRAGLAAGGRGRDIHL